MKAVETYRWRVRRINRWGTTSFHCTEEDIRVEHPEAERVEGTLVVRHEAETTEEQMTLASGGRAGTRIG